MATKQEAQKAIRKAFGAKQDALPAWPAFLGNEDGTVQGSQADKVYVRYPTLTSAAVEVYNLGVPTVAGLRVMVGSRPENPTKIGALGVADARTEITGTTIYGTLQNHGSQHGWTGSDPVFLRFHQITDLGVYISSGLTVQIFPGNVERNGAIVEVALQTLDLTSHVPSTALEGLFVLITLDGDGLVTATDGTPVADYHALTRDDIPAKPAGHFRLAAVRLYNGQTSIVDTSLTTDIIELRWAQDIGSYLNSTLTSAHLFVGNASNVATDTALSGDATLANTGAMTLATVNSNVGTFGDASNVAQVTVNAKGLVTAAANVALSAGAGQVTGLARWTAAASQTTFDLPDAAEYLLLASINGLIEDPAIYSLSADGTQLIFDTGVSASDVITANYIISQV